MKEPAATSPFAALTRQEQQERWMCWQCQRTARSAPEEHQPPESTPALPELRLPSAAPEPPKPPAHAAPPAIRHGQYDAVINRMRNAQRRVNGYQSWEASSTRHPASGSPNAL